MISIIFKKHRKRVLYTKGGIEIIFLIEKLGVLRSGDLNEQRFRRVFQENRNGWVAEPGMSLVY